MTQKIHQPKLPKLRFVHVFPSFGYGGVPIRIAHILNHMGPEIHHDIIALDGETASRTRLSPALDVNFPAIPYGNVGFVARLRHIRAWLKQHRVDLLLTYNWGAIEWAFANRWGPGYRQIHLESGFSPVEAERQLVRRVLFRRLALMPAASIIVPSLTLKSIATTRWKLPHSKVVHIPNGVDCDLFAQAPDWRMLPFKPTGPIIGTLAPLRREKNLTALIKCFAAVNDRFKATLVIAGDGAERQLLENCTRDLGVSERVCFLGHVETPERLLGLFDVFALTSSTEQMPNTVIQAMAAGCPIVGFDVGDVRHLVAEPGKSLITPKMDLVALGKNIEDLLGAPERAKSLGQENQRHVRAHYTQMRMFSAYQETFAKILDRPLPVAGEAAADEHIA